MPSKGSRRRRTQTRQRRQTQTKRQTKQTKEPDDSLTLVELLLQRLLAKEYGLEPISDARVDLRAFIRRFPQDKGIYLADLFHAYIRETVQMEYGLKGLDQPLPDLIVSRAHFILQHEFGAKRIKAS